MAMQVRRVSTAEAIVEHLLERIRLGEFGPGDRLPSERLLQEELGVGRLSLREGLARLSALGVIRVEHGKGATVQDTIDGGAIGQALVPLFPHRNAKTLTDLVEARGLIEGELAARAAARRTDKDVAALRAILDGRAANTVDQAALAELDFAFHREVARIADNEFLSAMLDALRDHVRAFLAEYVQAQKDARSIVERHRPILEAIEARDVDTARRVARKHIDVCKSSLDAYVRRLARERGA